MGLITQFWVILVFVLCEKWKQMEMEEGRGMGKWRKGTGLRNWVSLVLPADCCKAKKWVSRGGAGGRGREREEYAKGIARGQNKSEREGEKESKREGILQGHYRSLILHSPGERENDISQMMSLYFESFGTEERRGRRKEEKGESYWVERGLPG